METASTLTLTWTIELGVLADVDDNDTTDGDGAIIQVSPLFNLGGFDFRMVAAASKRPLSALGLYLEHFPQSSSGPSPPAVPSIKCRMNWSHAPSENGGEIMFDHAFDDPLSSSMLAGKADLIPLPTSTRTSRGGLADKGNLHVTATVTLLSVHFPSARERAKVESAAWERLVDHVLAGDDPGKDEQALTGGVERLEGVEDMRIFGRDEE